MELSQVETYNLLKYLKEKYREEKNIADDVVIKEYLKRTNPDLVQIEWNQINGYLKRYVFSHCTEIKNWPGLDTNVYVAKEDFTALPAWGRYSYTLIIPKDIHVILQENMGHVTVYKLELISNQQ